MTVSSCISCTAPSRQPVVVGRLVLPVRPGLLASLQDSEEVRMELHALGFVQAHVGNSLLLRTHLTDAGQAGDAAGLERARAMREGLSHVHAAWCVPT